MWVLLSRSHLHGENNSAQFTFYTDRFSNSWFFLVYVSGCGVFTVIHMSKSNEVCMNLADRRAYIFSLLVYLVV